VATCSLRLRSLGTHYEEVYTIYYLLHVNQLFGTNNTRFGAVTAACLAESKTALTTQGQILCAKR
jgi:hypothetical protein